MANRVPIVIAISVAWFSRVKRDGRFISAATSCYFFGAGSQTGWQPGRGEASPDAFVSANWSGPAD